MPHTKSKDMTFTGVLMIWSEIALNDSSMKIRMVVFVACNVHASSRRDHAN